MATTGKVYAGTVAQSSTGNSWTNLTNAQGNTPSTYAVCSLAQYDYAKVLSATNFDFSSIPDGSTINGVTAYVTVEGSGSGDLDLGIVQLIKSGTPSGDNKGTFVYITTKTEKSYGGASDTWSLSLTTVDLKDSTSGLKLGFWEDGTDSVDARTYSVALDVDYTVSGGGGGGGGSESNGFFLLVA